ncbi:MAG: hypothetical protein ACI8X5_003970 [Planctomycetota bacterium]|jgi:hypothetical protein
MTAPVTAAVPLTTEYAENINRTFGIRLGGVAYANFDTTVQVSSETGVGAVLDLEDFLGIDTSHSVVRMDMHYAFNRRHRVDLGYYDINRSGQRNLIDPIDIGDTTFPGGETITRMRTRILKLAYRYNFVTEPKTNIGASFGIHTMRIGLDFTSANGSFDESVHATAPLPLFGLHGSHSLSENWALYASGEFFALKLDEFAGAITDIRLGLDWDVFDHVGLGLEFNTFNMAADVKSDGLTADLEYGYGGLGIYLRGYL